MAGEEDAIRADEFLVRGTEEMKSYDGPGFLKVTRQVCKTEWAYEVSVIFDNLDNFKAYMDSSFREEKMNPLLAEVSKLAVDGEVYQGARVHDDM